MTYTSLGEGIGLRAVENVGLSLIEYLKYLKGDQERPETLEDEECNEVRILETPNELAYLKALNPTEWKSQDHYRVLGVRNRYLASENEIKSAYRAKVMRHHPDKRRAEGEEVGQEDYFVCITRAWEVLGDKRKRRSYDSVDPEFSNEIPANTEGNKKKFYEVFGEAFEMNSRWSEIIPVPQLGGPDSTRKDVEQFYEFWYNFQSWREFSYEDDEKEEGEDRDERRYIEKCNKAVRAKKKKEEMARIVKLVDTAYGMDPRIKKFKEEEKERKEALKKARIEAAKAKQEELIREQKEEEERLRREKEHAEAEEKAKREAAKAEKEAIKKILRKERKNLREICKLNNYFIESPNELVRHMEFVEKLCDTLSSSELKEISESLGQHGRLFFISRMTGKAPLSPTPQDRRNDDQWSQNSLDLLSEALQVFPPGTRKRWESITCFVNDRLNTKFIQREVISKAKELQGSKNQTIDSVMPHLDEKWSIESINLLIKAVKNFPQGTAKRWEVITRFMNEKCSQTFLEKEIVNQVKALEAQKPGEESQNDKSVNEEGDRQIFSIWTSDEQFRLETALRNFPVGTENRWELIAAGVRTKTKKECILRFKELSQLIKNKKSGMDLT